MKSAYKFHQVNGITLHAYHAGMQHEKVMVFLHGFPEYHYGWKNQLDFFASKGYHVVAPDQRGYGDSSKPAGINSYKLGVLTEDIVQLIKSITKEKVILVGHDWGGGVAWTLAQYHPELLEKLVIMNMPHLQVMKDTLKTSSEQRKKSWYAVFFQLPFLPEIVLSLFGYKPLVGSLTRKSNHGTFSKADLRAYRSAWQKTDRLKSMLNWYRAFLRNELDYSGKIHVPTRIIWGAKDQALTLQLAHKSIEKCSNGELFVLDDLTHWLHHEDPERVNALILEFLSAA
jgi:epoxide hydrolase 4